jgi:Putative zinc ribbon domain
MFRPKGPNCQSCGMPLSKDPLGGGSNADGSVNSEYCSHCYRKGVFTQPNITAAEMMKLVEGRLRSMHFPGFLARRFAREVPTLRRWRSRSASQVARSSASELQPRA